MPTDTASADVLLTSEAVPPARSAGVVLSIGDGSDLTPLLAHLFEPVGTTALSQDPLRWWQAADLDWVEAAPGLLCHPGDRVAWQRLTDALDRLHARRPARPIDGMVLHIDPAQTRSDADATRLALRARAVLDAIKQQVGWRVPLFVLLVTGRGTVDMATLLRLLPDEMRGQPIGHRCEVDKDPKGLFEATASALETLGRRLAPLAALAPRDRAEAAWRAIPLARAALGTGTAVARSLLGPSDGTEPARLAGVYVVPAGPPDTYGLDTVARIIPADLGHVVRA
ncbi:MAG: hypothetical protein H6843_03885 [Rhodospirillaceae bacterium]|nr:hypothetical protein [Rhodospirillaceae bacterium]